MNLTFFKVPNCSSTNQEPEDYHGPPSESKVIDFAYPRGPTKNATSTMANEPTKPAGAPETTSTPAANENTPTPVAIKKSTLAAITEKALPPLPSQNTLLPTVFKGNHPAFREMPAPQTADSASSTMHSRSTTPDSASAATDSNGTSTSDSSNKFVGGSHQMSDVKLPGYWTHERTAELRDMAKKDVATNATIDGSGEDPKAEPQCDQCEEEKKKKKGKGLFKEEFKKKKFLQKLFRRKA
ncbi:hypothetical protein HBH56_153220 [Parastagonospora nodorum]|uniref:Uncharacterized protein n=1 Tax=Phaeosphaeria nodorum (strain SN15 / ATCC MYA-4574 / FGSC 10173) TaxID=321614 RepID=A0A7U2EZL6_PHANO|nr:hypothetical protein HBH56_153220 [Parastagonospora nodorum]QRC96023.1 hypothetical protein JI435_056640 [Parastagonospora nodorum SN15]KAH3926808.1 hypothetical protein HBH54_164460 [Parastagonospora nodorum]KAH3940352.1 hypothetical protein HBH53_217400 [Parastagonospora nodorum]KAH4029512.1 hypothetical protein HBI09_134320 [Parastagonospora nodorum]